MLEPINMLVAGVGNPHVMLYLAGAGRNVSLSRFIAVAEANPELLQRAKNALAQYPGVRYYSDVNEMFARHPEADAVMIGSDNIDHFRIFEAAVQRGLHLYMMKVISMDEGECRRMIEIEKNYEKIIAVELELKFAPQFRMARELVRSGKLGKIRSIYLTNISQSPINYFPNWGDPLLCYGKRIPIHARSKVFRGGAITDHPHPFDMIRWITGREFATIRAISARNQRSFLEVEDHAAMTGELDDGTIYFINPSYSNMEEKVPRRVLIWPKSLECNLKITGDNGYYSTDFFDRPSLECGPGLPSPNRLLVDGVPRMTGRDDDNLLGRFVACIRGAASDPGSSLDDSYQAVRVMNAAYESIASNREVELQL